MKSMINTQSKNEVKDLLNEYVVSPLNTDISSTLTEMGKKIESLEEIKKEIGNIPFSVNANISRLQRLLGNSFHFDTEEDVFENINESIEDSQVAITEKIDNSQEAITEKIDNSQKALYDINAQIKTLLTQLKSDFKNADERINDATKQNNKELISNVSGHFKEICELLDNINITSDTSTKEIIALITFVQSSIFNELNSLSILLREFYEQSNKKSEDIQRSSFSELHGIETLINEKYDSLNVQINSTLQTVSSTFDEQNTKLSKLYEETTNAMQTNDSEQMASINQKYKALFAVSLSFGVTNTIGLILIIVLFLLK